jgi:hypothetical protein
MSRVDLRFHLHIIPEQYYKGIRGCLAGTILQTVIVNKFQDRTVMVIAYRLYTMAKSNRILLL